MSGIVTPVRGKPIEDIQLTPAELELIEKQAKIYGKLINAGERKATYKVELFFDSKRSTWKPFGGLLMLWQSGARMHGGGDMLLHICPRPDCEAVMKPDQSGDGFFVCHQCGSRWDRERVYDTVAAHLTAKKWAVLALKWYSRLGHDADIALKYAPEDIRSRAKQELERQRKGELYASARASRERATGLYPLANIIKDTSGGASLLSRFEAFLLS